MQYQSTLDRDGLVDLALNKYFGNVDNKNLDAVMDCFHENAMLTVQTSFTIHEGKENIQPNHLAEAIQYRSLDREGWAS